MGTTSRSPNKLVIVTMTTPAPLLLSASQHQNMSAQLMETKNCVQRSGNCAACKCCSSLGLLGLLTDSALTVLASTATDPKPVPKMVDVAVPLVIAVWYADALVLSPFKNMVVVATSTDPADMLSMMTLTGLPDRLSTFPSTVAMNCST